MEKAEKLQRKTIKSKCFEKDFFHLSLEYWSHQGSYLTSPAFSLQKKKETCVFSLSPLTSASQQLSQTTPMTSTLILND